MPSYILTASNPETPPFDFLGDCYISIKGTGVAHIKRKISGEFDVMTTKEGVLLSFEGPGVMFNDCITANKKMEHKIVADTTGEVVVEILKERG